MNVLAEQLLAGDVQPGDTLDIGVGQPVQAEGNTDAESTTLVLSVRAK